MILQQFLAILSIELVLCGVAVRYANFVIPHGTGKSCPFGQSLGSLADENTSKLTCAIACTNHEDCTGFHVSLSTGGVTCELRQGLCTDAMDMEDNADVTYYHSADRCPRSWVRVFTNGTNVIFNTCNVIPWAMVASVSDCIVRACTSGISGFSYYMPDGNCIARVCPTHGLYISPNNLYSEYEIYAAVGNSNVTYV